MKLILCGNVIDTELIYKISDIFFAEWINGYCYPANQEIANVIAFEIKFLNRSVEQISIDRTPENEVKIIKVREELIKFWSTGQIKIPKIDFE